MDKNTLAKIDGIGNTVLTAMHFIEGASVSQLRDTARPRAVENANALGAALHVLHEVKSEVENEVMTPNAIVWSTSTQPHAPKKYFILIKEDDGTQIPLEIAWHTKERKVTADVYKPDDYDYTIHDGCDHENGSCIEDDPDFYEQMQRDNALIRAGYKEPKQDA